MNFCIGTEVTYPNYTKRIKQNILKEYFNHELDKAGIKYYISTNRVEDFEEFKDHPTVKVFDVNELRKDVPESFQYELYPENPKGLYPSRYPWNMRRFVLRKAAEDGLSGVCYLDADIKVHSNLSKVDVQRILISAAEPNTVGTNSAIFEYKNKKPDDVFNFHDLYIKHFNLNFLPEQYNTLDGPTQFFMGDSPEKLMLMYEKWNFFTLFGYRKEFGYGYDNNKHGNLSFAIPSAGFQAKYSSLPFFPAHAVEDRY